MGPTASGKSALAVHLAEHFPFEIVSVDASQVYRGLDVGTAKPGPAERARARHHLIDIRDPSQTYSAAEFREDALRVMAEIAGRGRLPLLVGGTLLYFRALERGLSPLPPADRAMRAEIEAEARAHGWPALHKRLASLDPEAARRIDPHDAQRIERALEIHRLTGRAPSRLLGARGRVPFPYAAIKIVLTPADRAELHRRIETRFRAMAARGLIEETERLCARGLSPKLPALRAVGYRQAREYLTKAVSYSEMIQRGIAATRQLAKRQLTWLRHEPGVVWFDSGRRGHEVVVRRFFASLLADMGL